MSGEHLAKCLGYSNVQKAPEDQVCESLRRLWSVLVRNVKIRQTDVVKYWQRRSQWVLCRSGAMELVKCAPNRPSSEFKQWIFDQFYNPDAPRLPGIASDPGFVFIVTNDNLERVNKCKMCTVRGQDIGSVVDYLERMNVVFVSEHFQALRIVGTLLADRSKLLGTKADRVSNYVRTVPKCGKR